MVKNMIWIKNSIVKFFTNPRCVFFLGLAIALLATSLEVFRGRCTNYYDYYDATMMFWSGISPYTQEFYGTHCLYFLYSPVYTTVYAPVFLLPWWLGPFVWNIGNYCLFCLAIKMLPEPLAPHAGQPPSVPGQAQPLLPSEPSEQRLACTVGRGLQLC